MGFATYKATEYGLSQPDHMNTAVEACAVNLDKDAYSRKELPEGCESFERVFESTRIVTYKYDPVDGTNKIISEQKSYNLPSAQQFTSEHLITPERAETEKDVKLAMAVGIGALGSIIVGGFSLAGRRRKPVRRIRELG